MNAAIAISPRVIARHNQKS